LYPKFLGLPDKIKAGRGIVDVSKRQAGYLIFPGQLQQGHFGKGPVAEAVVGMAIQIHSLFHYFFSSLFFARPKKREKRKDGLSEEFSPTSGETGLESPPSRLWRDEYHRPFSTYSADKRLHPLYRQRKRQASLKIAEALEAI
jgi:hypothetical protein